MRILYIAKIDSDYSLDLGVLNKIKGQIEAFKNLDASIDFLHLKNKNIVLNDRCIKKISTKKIAFLHFYLHLKKNRTTYDLVYIRYARANPNFLRTVKLLKKMNIKVIVEIPTYPYKREIGNSIFDKFDNLIDDYITKKLHKYVFRISTTNNYDSIFNIETIKINNGVSENSVPIRKRASSDEINFIGIANLAPWHGYDRLIRGIDHYYRSGGQQKVNFYIVGEGKAKKSLVELTRELCLENYVYFTGSKTGVELNDLFNIMDIGVSSLALHRADGGHDPIKSKEYLMRGIPILLSYSDKLIDMSLPFVFKVQEDDTSIDVYELIDKFNEIGNISNYSIRHYAIEYLSWNSQIIKILNVIE